MVRVDVATTAVIGVVVGGGRIIVVMMLEVVAPAASGGTGWTAAITLVALTARTAWAVRCWGRNRGIFCQVLAM